MLRRSKEGQLGNLLQHFPVINSCRWHHEGIGFSTDEWGTAVGDIAKCSIAEIS